MSSRRGGRRRAGHAAAGHDNDERWLLTYSDMITLLMALFMVLFSISSVNVSKYRTLQQSLHAAFSGSILSGGRAILQSGSQSTSAHSPATSAVPSIMPLTPNIPKPSMQGLASNGSSTQAQAQVRQAIANEEAASQEQSDFIALQHRIDAYAAAHGFANNVQTLIQARGLVVRILTDKLLFDSGQATLQPEGLPLLEMISHLLMVDTRHPVLVEGYTDSVPISTAQFPSNWELSTARATTVVRFLIARGISDARLGAAGYAYLDPIATNATAAGRALNRRVQIVFERIYPEPTSNPVSTP